MLDFYSHQQEEEAAAALPTHPPTPFPPIPPRAFTPRGHTEEEVGGWVDGRGGGLVSRVNVQEVWDDADEARWIARRVRELFLSFASASFSWEEKKVLFEAAAASSSSSSTSSSSAAAAVKEEEEEEEEEEEDVLPSMGAGEDGPHHLAILVRSGYVLSFPPTHPPTHPPIF